MTDIVERLQYYTPYGPITDMQADALMKESANEIERLREALRKINKATISHVNGADLLDDLHPRDEINIVVRIDGENVWHEGDWLSYLRDAVIEARSALEEKE